MRIHHKPPQEEGVDEAFGTQTLGVSLFQDLVLIGVFKHTVICSEENSTVQAIREVPGLCW